MRKILLPIFILMLMAGCRNQPPTAQANDQAQEEPHPTEIMVENFFSTFKEGGVILAFTELLGPYYNLLGKEDNPFQFSISKFKEETEALGGFTEYEIISVKPIGDNLIAYRYLVKYKSQPLRFTFVFYNFDSWRLQEFHYDGNIIDDLIDMMKYRDVE